MACLRLNQGDDRHISLGLIPMKTYLLKSLLGAALLAGLAAGATAQTTTTTSPTTTTPIPLPKPPTVGRLGPELRQIIAEHRDALNALLRERWALLAQLKNATPDQIAALRAQLRELMRQTQQEQRELAKAIRDAIKARRDQLHKSPPSGG
jgi:hypothetical protein